jgi:hypothetical protein
VAVAVGVGVLVGVAVGGTAVLVAVAVGGTAVLVAVGGIAVLVGVAVAGASIVHMCMAGVVSTLPAGSMARTLKKCPPTAKPG